MKHFIANDCDMAAFRVAIAKHTKATQRMYIVGVQVLFSHAVRFGLAESNPYRGIELPKRDSVVGPTPTIEERDRLFEWMRKNDPELYVSCALVHYTFVRPTESYRIGRRGVRIDHRQVIVSANHSKNKRSATVYIIDPLFDILKEHPDTQPLPYFRLRYRFMKACQACGIPNYTPYSLKRCGAILASNAGATLLDIQAMCRHVSASTTDIYLRSIGATISPTLRHLKY